MLATSCLHLSPTKRSIVVWHSLVRQGNTTFDHQLRDIAVAEEAAVVRPRAVADDFGWESMTLVWIGGRSWGAYAPLA